MAKTILTIKTAEKLEELGFVKFKEVFTEPLEGYTKDYKGLDGKNLFYCSIYHKNGILVDSLGIEIGAEEIELRSNAISPTTTCQEVEKAYSLFQKDVSALNATILED